VERGALHGDGGRLGSRRGTLSHGCVTPGAEYEAVRDQIIDGLRSLADPEGHRVFDSVQRREHLYRGPFVERAPDVVAVCTPRFGIIFESLARELRDRALFGPFEELGYTGTHDPLGIYLFAGRRSRARESAVSCRSRP
jgi:predicted AlkP superfamily phosphohydrolase/phosphomutase